MMIMAKAIAGVSEKAEVKTRKSRRALVLLSVASAVVVAVLVAVIWVQNRRINTLVAEKAAIDQQIQSTLVAMSNEDDEQRLSQLEEHLDQLVGNASDKLLEVKRASASRAEELTEPSDELDQQIRKILHDFHADTYAIPPVFRAALQEQVEALRKSPGLKDAFARKRQYWPAVQRALRRQKLPTELGYIAFTESSFDPTAVNPKSGAAGLWQLMDEVAKNCGISVEPGADERLDPQKSSEAASCYLSKLLIEFGEESFMLALASYNRGENGVRRALHRLAQEPGGFRKRDFWHLYRLKYLPQETREYVPKVLAAAIVLGEPRPAHSP
jgi:soluble lytic murein transglycosylase-like protein